MGSFNFIIWVNYDVGPSALEVAIEYGLGFVISYGMQFFYARNIDRSIAYQIILSMAVAIPMAIVWRASVNYMQYVYFSPINDALTIGYLFHNGPASYLLLLAWSIGFWLINYYQKFLQQQARLRQVELEAHKAQLKMLRFQINPHFLFNVLANIDSMLLSKNFEASRRMLMRMSNYLRATLEDNQGESHTLSSEFNLLTLYTAIEEERFGDRLTSDFPTKIPHANMKVPQHFLQPLVENAIKHGISKLPSGGKIKIVFEEDEDHLLIVIENPIPNTQQASQGFRMGIKNVRQRLDTFFKQDTYITTNEENGTFRVVIKLPVGRHDI
jgi:hypothetical protein